MSKTYRTKRKILKMLSANENTLTGISRELGLAPSTISKHLKELRGGGRIELIDNPYFRRTKYYRIPQVINGEVYSQGIGHEISMTY